MDASAQEQIDALITYAMNNKGKLDDSTKLALFTMVKAFYENNAYKPVWSHEEKWNALTDSLVHFIENGERYGLFPKDYHHKQLKNLYQLLQKDSVSRMDAGLWSRADLLLTDGILNIMLDLKKGRLQPDSVYNRTDSLPNDNFYVVQLEKALKQKSITPALQSLEPDHRGYKELKKAIPAFLDSMDRRAYTYVNYPYKDSTDSIRFIRVLQKAERYYHRW
jgi:L,D-transpeptidase YcbB